MITIYISNSTQKKENTIYAKKAEICTLDELKNAVSYDYVCAKYKDNKRSKDNFIESDCLPFDIDNDHTDEKEKWITPEDVAKAFPNVEFYVHYSRHHMVAKNDKEARPKFHIFFRINKCTNADDYARLKIAVHKFYPYVDEGALDSARFFFGTNNPKVTYFKGDLPVDEFLNIYSTSDMTYEVDENGEIIDSVDINTSREIIRSTIPSGERNSTMFRLGRKILWRHDDTEIAYKLFLEQASYCDPELSDEEIGTIWKSLRSGLDKCKKDGNYVPPSEFFKKEIENQTLKPNDFTDLGQAEVMARYFKGKIAFSTATDFLVYKDNYWQEDSVLAKRCAQIITDKQLEEANTLFFAAKKKVDSLGGVDALSLAIKNSGGTEEQLDAVKAYNEAKEYQSYAIKRRNSGKLTSSLTELEPLVQTYVKDLDCDPFLLCTPKATYDLRKGIKGAMASDPKYMLTKITTVSPSLRGKDRWEDFLNTAFDNDQELIDYVQKICGLAVIGKVYLEGIIISYGDGGNGKSTFWNTIARVLGSYYGKISADALTTNCKRNVKPELAELRGKRLIIASESQEGARLNDSEIKELCSTDDIRAEKKFKDPFDFTPTHTLVLYTNHLPKVKGTDDGIWRRIIVIPFNHKFTKNDSDIKNYSDVLYEESGEYILTWVIEGARKAYEANFKIKNPKVVQIAIDNYKKDNDWFGRFVDECCIIDKSKRCKSADIYQKYRDFAAFQGERPRGTIEFYTELERRGFERARLLEDKNKKTNFVIGIAIKSDEIFDDFDILN